MINLATYDRIDVAVSLDKIAFKYNLTELQYFPRYLDIQGHVTGWLQSDISNDQLGDLYSPSPDIRIQLA